MERMDFDIGSLIYILITVVAIIGGIAGKKKKPAKGVTSEDGESNSPKSGFFGKLEQQLESFAVQAKGSLEDLTGQSLSNEPEIAEVDERDYFEKRGDEYEAIDKDDLKNNFAQYEGLYSPDDEQNFELIESEGISTTGALELTSIDEDIEPVDFDLRILEEFDARTAVIYSSIINRIEI